LAAAGWFGLQPDQAGPRVEMATRATESPAAPPSPDRSAAAVRLASGATAAPADSAKRDVRLKIDMATTDWCWVAAESDGERVLYRLLEPGERVVLEGEREIALRLGDAGSVTVSINDGPRLTPGGDGEVIEVVVTPDNVESLRDGVVEIIS
jgi:hypothetical protein